MAIQIKVSGLDDVFVTLIIKKIKTKGLVHLIRHGKSLDLLQTFKPRLLSAIK